MWQVAQDASLNTGPSPSSIGSTSSNSSRPASNRAISSAVRPEIGWPSTRAGTASIPPAKGPGSLNLVSHAASEIRAIDVRAQHVDQEYVCTVHLPRL